MGPLDPCRIDVDHIPVEVELHLAARLDLAIEGGTVATHTLMRLMHNAHQLVTQALLVHLAKLRELGGLDGGVELHVGANPWQEVLLPHLLKEELKLPLVRLVRVEVIAAVEVWQSPRDELWASIGKQFLKAELLSTLQTGLLLHMGLVDLLFNSLVYGLGAERQADEEERIHLVLFLHDLAVLVRQRIDTRCLRQEDKDIAEGLNRINITPLHHVCEAHVVVQGDVASGNGVEEGHLRMEVDASDGAHGQIIIPEEAVHAEELHESAVAEEANMLIGERPALLALGVLGVLEVLLNLRGLDNLVQVGENGGGLEDIRVLLDLRDVLFFLNLHRLVAKVAVGLVVVHELI
mmetsp:Transcript_87070/g.186654  ORF Transcript_87070/g.186654 Transcript_87070/m.186654 type:complete len:350 (-) Transcript_87070:518-1567(-)